MAIGPEADNSIHVQVGHSADVVLFLSSGTGYTWVLTALPDCLGLMDVASSGTSASPGGVNQESFTFAAVKAGSGQLVFQLLRPWDPAQPADTRNFQVKVEPASKTTAALEASMGKGNFLPPMVHTTVMDPCMPYGFPNCGTDVRALYNYPIDHHPISLKYGYPIPLKYGYPVPMYAIDRCPPHVEYGVPCEAATLSQAKSGVLPAPSMMASRTNCQVKYGTPWGKADQPEQCRLMYGVPIDPSAQKK